MAPQQRQELLPKLHVMAQACGRTAVIAGEAPCQTYEDWSVRMAAALDDTQRQVLLLYAQEALEGYMMYSVQGDVILLENAVIAPEYQYTPLFRNACQHLLMHLPPQIRYLDDYVSKDRPAAIEVNKKIGMKIVGETESGSHVRMRASIPDVRGLF